MCGEEWKEGLSLEGGESSETEKEKSREEGSSEDAPSERETSLGTSPSNPSWASPVGTKRPLRLDVKSQWSETRPHWSWTRGCDQPRPGSSAAM